MCYVFTALWPRWAELWIFTNINSCGAGWGCACLFTARVWFEWQSSGVVGIYDHEPSWCCSLWLRNFVWLRSIGCRPDPCTWSHTCPPDDWRSEPSTGCCCSTHRLLRSLLVRGVRLLLISPLISVCPISSLMCSARVRHCLPLLVGVVDWCESPLVRLICCRIMLTASSPGSLLISR